MVRAIFLAALLALGGAARGAEEPPEALRGLGVDPVAGAALPLEVPVMGEDGKSVPLRSFFDGRRPVLLVLSYYGCPMLCGLLLNNVRSGLEELGWPPGERYRVLTLSIDPHETAELAATKKAAILRTSAGQAFRSAAEREWHFLVGAAGSEKRVADALGFRYRWDPAARQWAHGTAVFLLSPSGRLSRVLYGLELPPTELKLGLLEAGQGRVGAIASKLLLFCYHYDAEHGRYSLLVGRLVRLGGGLTLGALALAWIAWWRRWKINAMRLRR